MIRHHHSNELKFKVAREALRGDLSLAEIVTKYGVNESLVYRWKKQLLEQGAEAFAEEDSSHRTDALTAHGSDNPQAIQEQLKLEKVDAEKARSKAE